MSDKELYKESVKTTSVYGGVQILNILVSILKSKMIAILLGPSGMGISALLSSTTGLVSALTNFGIGVSAVKNVSQSSHDDEKIASLVKILRIWMLITGLIGTAITLVFAPILSELSFNNKNFSISFGLLSVTLLIYQLIAGENAILQGMRKVNFIVKVGLINSLLSLLIGFPLYYYYGNGGIVPTLIITAVLNLLVIKYFTNKLRLARIPKPTKEEIKTTGFSMMKIGFLISISGLITVFCSYLIRIYIGKIGSMQDVGLYTAGFTLVSTYVGMILNSISADFYPRLSAVAHQNREAEKVINQQVEITVLMLAPILVLLIVFVKIGLVFLYSNKFLSITTMIQWAALGVFFQCISWIFAYIFLSKADSKAFFWNELFITVLMLGLNILGYRFYGLNGLGIAFFVLYVAYFFQTMYVVSRKYKININSQTIGVVSTHLVILIIVFLAAIVDLHLIKYIVEGICIIASICYSYVELDKRIHIKDIIVNRLNRFKN